MEAKTQAKAVLRYARISPRKVNIVTDLIRNKNVATARGILMNTPKAASALLIKLLDSAVANAENNFGMDMRMKVLHSRESDPERRAEHSESEKEQVTLQSL